MRALIAASTAVGWNSVVLPATGWDRRRRTAANAVFATAFAAAFGRRTPWTRPGGIRFGLLAAAVPAAGYIVVAAVPAGRRALESRVGDADLLGWVAIDIPVGTVFTEELVFRGIVTPLAEEAFGTGAGRLFGATAFGLWHIRPAVAAGDSVVGTVLVTAVAGGVFDWLARRGGIVAPALLHLSSNVGGVVAGRL